MTFIYLPHPNKIFLQKSCHFPPFPGCTSGQFQLKLALFHDTAHFVFYLIQRAKKVVSNSPGLVDFAIRLVSFVLNLPDGHVLFFGEIQITEGL